jgi:hypothetical protein
MGITIVIGKSKLQGILNKARAEIDTDLPAASNRIDILWHEMGTLLRKG